MARTPRADEHYLQIINNDSVSFPDTSRADLNVSGTVYFDKVPKSTISIQYLTASSAGTPYTALSSTVGSDHKYYLNSLKNTINSYRSISKYYDDSYYTDREVAIVCIPSVFYGKSIQKGTVGLDFYYSGTLYARAEDVNLNGELIQTTGSVTGGVAGVVLYDQGFVLLTGSWPLLSVMDNYVYYSASTGVVIGSDYPKWTNWGKSLVADIPSASYDINFSGITEINTLTLLTHANRGEFNTSNNLTYIDHTANTLYTPATSSNYYIEDKKIPIKNTVNVPYTQTSGSFIKQVFISKIGIFDKDKNLLAVAKLATPLKKSDSKDYTIKLKLDI